MSHRENVLLQTNLRRTLDRHIDEIIEFGDAECAIDCLPIIDAARRRLDNVQANPPRYRERDDDGYSSVR